MGWVRSVHSGRRCPGRSARSRSVDRSAGHSGCATGVDGLVEGAPDEDGPVGCEELADGVVDGERGTDEFDGRAEGLRLFGVEDDGVTGGRDAGAGAWKIRCAGRWRTSGRAPAPAAAAMPTLGIAMAAIAAATRRRIRFGCGSSAVRSSGSLICAGSCADRNWASASPIRLSSSSVPSRPAAATRPRTGSSTARPASGSSSGPTRRFGPLIAVLARSADGPAFSVRDGWPSARLRTASRARPRPGRRPDRALPAA